jgi:hypothetical protein
VLCHNSVPTSAHKVATGQGNMTRHKWLVYLVF